MDQIASQLQPFCPILVPIASQCLDKNTCDQLIGMVQDAAGPIASQLGYPLPDLTQLLGGNAPEAAKLLVQMCSGNPPGTPQPPPLPPSVPALPPPEPTTTLPPDNNDDMMKYLLYAGILLGVLLLVVLLVYLYRCYKNRLPTLVPSLAASRPSDQGRASYNEATDKVNYRVRPKRSGRRPSNPEPRATKYPY